MELGTDLVLGGVSKEDERARLVGKQNCGFSFVALYNT